MNRGTLCNTLTVCLLMSCANLAMADETQAPAQVQPGPKAKSKPAPRTPPKPKPRKVKAAPALPPIEINSATKEQLMTLPGVNAQVAARIIAGRPYNAKTNLFTRHILPEGDYPALRDRLIVNPPRIPRK